MISYAAFLFSFHTGIKMHNLTETILLLLLIEIYELNKASLCDDYFYVSVLQRRYHHLIIINVFITITHT